MDNNAEYHLLSTNRGSARPQYLVFVDTETAYKKVSPNRIEHTLRLGVAHYWRRRQDRATGQHDDYYFKSARDFWDWTLSKTAPNTTLYLVAHNWAFDAPILNMFNILPARGYKLTFIYEQGMTRLIKWGFPSKAYLQFLLSDASGAEFKGRKWQHVLFCVDNTNLFPGKLENWGNALNLPKMTMPAKNADETAWFKYCQRDVDIMVKLWQAWLMFLDEHDMGNFRTTLASQAFSTYRHRFMPVAINTHRNKKVVSLEREGYHGGRTQAFFVGKLPEQKYYYLDVNSMYPYVMKKERYPYKLAGYKKETSVRELSCLLRKYAVMAEVLINTELPIYPYLHNNRIVYPVGEFKTVLSTPELLDALQRNIIRAVYRIAWYNQADLFSEYVDYFYALKLRFRRNGQKLRCIAVKLLLNSLYGKFGQKGYQDTVVGYENNNNFYTEYVLSLPERERFTRIHAGGSVIEQRRKGENRNSFVAIAAHVTAYARMYLWKLVSRAGEKNVFYIDTDSLITNEQGFNNLKTYVKKDILGYLKVENTSNHCVIYAPKDYIFGTETKHKGVPHGAQEIGPATYQVEIWPSLKGLLLAERPAGYFNKIVTKRLSRKVEYGNLTPSGWVEPFVIK